MALTNAMCATSVHFHYMGIAVDRGESQRAGVCVFVCLFVCMCPMMQCPTMPRDGLRCRATPTVPHGVLRCDVMTLHDAL